MSERADRVVAVLRRVRAILPDLLLWPALWLGFRRRGRRTRVLLAVHHYAPRISGAGLHVQWMAENLLGRGYDCWVLTARERGEPREVNGVRILSEPRLANCFDVVFTYSSLPLQAALAKQVSRWKKRPQWLHHPCAQADAAMIRGCDRVIAMNPRDVAVTDSACGGTAKVRRIRVGAHESRRGEPEVFRRKYGIESDYILWVGAWLPAKGVQNLCSRFLEFRKRHPDRNLKLVMFGGYGDRERPIADPDIVVVDGNSEDVPSAVRDCLFVAFNSPPAPIGFDANPIILLEGLMNGKTFLAQAGTPSLQEIGRLGMVVESDADWQRAAEVLVFDDARRAELEQSCSRAYRETYNFEGMMDDFAAAIEEVRRSG